MEFTISDYKINKLIKLFMKKTIELAFIFLSILLQPVELFSQSFGNALEFEGTNDYVFIGNDASLQVDQFTLTAWVHPYSYSDPIPDEQRMEIFEKAGEYWMNISTNGGYLRDKGEVRVGGFFDGQWLFLDSKYIVPLNEWTHVACTFDSDSLIIYINGKYDTARAIPGDHTDHKNADNMLALGCKCVSSEFGPIEAQFHGMLDEMSIWNTVLSQSEIENIMNEGIDNTHAKRLELRAYYRLNEDKLGENSGAVIDEMAINNGKNYGAVWVTSSLVNIYSETYSPLGKLLQQNYPNPFVKSTFISFELDKATRIQLDVYDLTGKLIKNLVNDKLQSGNHVVEWRAEGMIAGIYLYKLVVGEYFEVKKCIIEP